MCCDWKFPFFFSITRTPKSNMAIAIINNEYNNVPSIFFIFALFIGAKVI